MSRFQFMGINATSQQPPPFGPDRDAFNEGFKDANDKYLNRLMRDRFEQGLSNLGITDYSPAYTQLAGGRPLTSNAVLQDMINNLGTLAPAPKPAAPAPPAAPAAPAPTQTPQSDIYKQQADEAMAAAQRILDEFKIEQKRSQEAAALAEKMRIQSQQTLAANMARSQMAPNLQIQPASGTPQTAGTQSFRRRQSQFTPRGEAGAVLAGLNLGQSNMLNV